MLFAISNENNINIAKDQQTICNTAIYIDFSNAFQSKHLTRINRKTNLANCWSKNCETHVCRQACSRYRSAQTRGVVVQPRHLKRTLALSNSVHPYANRAAVKTLTEQSQAFCLIELICWILLLHVLACLCVYGAEPAHLICLLPWLTLNVTSNLYHTKRSLWRAWSHRKCDSDTEKVLYIRKSRHRRIKKQRRYERLAATSQLSLW